MASTKSVIGKSKKALSLSLLLFSLSGSRRLIIGVGADIHIFVFTDCKNNRFQKKLMMLNKNI